MVKLLHGLTVQEMEEIVLQPVHIRKDRHMERMIIRRLQKKAQKRAQNEKKSPGCV